jgi:hypothetical protein
MLRLHFHLHNGVDKLLDERGSDMPLETVVRRALIEARAIIADDVLSGLINLAQRIDVEDADGNVIHSIAFVDAVQIV